jgi:hypothetical protein
MTYCIALLRGINVTGHNIIRMAALQTSYGRCANHKDASAKQPRQIVHHWQEEKPKSPGSFVQWL